MDVVVCPVVVVVVLVVLVVVTVDIVVALVVVVGSKNIKLMFGQNLVNQDRYYHSYLSQNLKK